ncbi:S8 family serine peptidase [Aquimarina longa]|uniref:S8 family serine peptidase n=1 Tax=Aquimarina longa TaxID=1080221 RepID=UPI000781C988|nr:S8 family serine peptidase [Aquimarina longa]
MKTKVKKEDSYEFYDKLLGKKRSFIPNEEQVVVSLRVNEIESQDVLDEKTTDLLNKSSVFDLDSGFAIIEKLSLDVLNTASSDVDSLSDKVANSIPSLVDEEENTHYFMPDEFTVQFEENLSEDQIEKILKKEGCTIAQKQRTEGYYTLYVPSGKGLFETMEKFNRMDEVLFSEASEVGIEDALYTPNDPDFKKLWGLKNTGQSVNGTSGINDADIDANLAWNQQRGNRKVIIAVIDTGVDYKHEDLKNNILSRGSEDWNFASALSKDPMDSGTHGTHVAGTAAAVDNTKGIIGVAPRCKIMPLRVNLTSGKNANRADAINYVAKQAKLKKNNRYVINCSWRMSGHHTGVYNAIRKAVKNNVVVVFAAGNANRNIDIIPQYPAIYSQVIAVAATDQKDKRASFSNYGKKVDVSAPGVNIWSTVPNNNHNGYSYKNGTSMASPHVAGLAGLIWSKNKDLTNAQVRKIIEQTTDNIDAKNPGFAGKLGTGRINAYKAIKKTPKPKIKTKLIKTFNFPQANAGSSTGMAYARSIRVHPIPFFPKRKALLFVTQKAFSEKIYLLNPINGAVIKSFDPPANNTLGSLGWDGKFIHGANVTTGSGSINKFHPFNGSLAGSISAPAGRGEGLTFYGSYAYYSTINKIHKIKKSNGVLLNSVPAPGGSCHAIVYGDGYLFCGNTNTGKITVVKRSNFKLRDTIIAPGGVNKRVDALAYDTYSNTLYIANQKLNKIYKVKLTF